MLSILLTTVQCDVMDDHPLIVDVPETTDVFDVTQWAPALTPVVAREYAPVDWPVDYTDPATDGPRVSLFVGSDYATWTIGGCVEVLARPVPVTDFAS